MKRFNSKLLPPVSTALFLLSIFCSSLAECKNTKLNEIENQSGFEPITEN